MPSLPNKNRSTRVTAEEVLAGSIDHLSPGQRRELVTLAMELLAERTFMDEIEAQVTFRQKKSHVA